MDIFEAIKERRSYRDVFGAREVTQQELRKIVEAGMAAPSGKNRQTTEFVIVDQPALLGQIAGMNPTNKAFQSAKAMIFCIMDADPQAVYEDSFAVEDCAAAVENMLLAITALGLATVWIQGWLQTADRAQKVGKILGLPQNKIVSIMLPIGAPTIKVSPREKKSFEQRAFWNRYK